MKRIILKVICLLQRKLTEQKSISESTRKPNPEWPTVFCDGNNQHMIMFPNGTVFGPIFSTKVYDESGEYPYCEFKGLVNLATNEEEAIKVYGDFGISIRYASKSRPNPTP